MTNPIQVLFLDIDGVLNCEPHFRFYHKHPEAWRRPGTDWCSICVGNFKELLERAPDNLRIVLSSSWRIGCNTLPEVRAIFDIRGVDSSRIIDRTPELWSGTRGQEIDRWLTDNRKSLRVRNYVILDDESDMAPVQRHLVRTDVRVGLTLPIVDRVLNRLKNHATNSRETVARRY